MLQKRLDYGFNGYQVPFIPRAARSARKRGPIRKKIEDKQLCAFDLLATVAGNLLEGKSSHDKFTEHDQSVNAQLVITEEKHGEGNPLKVEHCDPGGVVIPSLSLELGLQAQVGHYDVNGTPGPQLDVSSALGSVITSSDCLEKDDSLDKVDLHDDKGELCSHSGKAEGFSPVYMNPCPPNINEFSEQHDGGEQLFGNAPDVQCSEDPKVFDRKPPALVTADGNDKLSFGQDKYPCGSFPLSGANNVTVVTRDDDENLSECTQPSTLKKTRSPARIGDRKLRKLLASKYWRLVPKVRDGDISETELRCIYRSRRFGYKRQRSQRIYPFKKRKYFHYTSLSNSDGDIGCNGIYKSPKITDTTATGFGAVGRGVNGSPSCAAGQSTPFPSRESHVKLRIKSFRVPELIIEMPETATVGSLKRRVMEAVTALLGGGFRFGVLLQGKKIRDDTRTLLQSGICHDEKVESLGFALEPNSSQMSPPACSEDNSVLLCNDVPDPVSRFPATSTIHQVNSHLSSDHVVNNLGNLIESDHESAQSPAEISAEKGIVDSRALVALPEGTPQALAVVPAHQKSKRSDMARRRIRRPFSVTEVEALVQAVEKLGTGRWRDVKLLAFDNMKHRTYVDLKDKWKTLVHTTRISPQQRRGEPVPQELLDRVLSAHAYWTQQQAKQQLKQQSEACLLF